jgi:hypothetical protein
MVVRRLKVWNHDRIATTAARVVAGLGADINERDDNA